MSVTLRAGGKSATDLETQWSATKVLSDWDVAVRGMLDAAARSAPARERVEKMRLWLEVNPFHDRHAERHEQYWLAKMDANAVDGKLMDLTENVARLQNQMTPQQLAGLSALFGMHLYPNVSMMFARYAQRLVTTDVFEIVSRWQMDQVRAERAVQEAR